MKSSNKPIGLLKKSGINKSTSIYTLPIIIFSLFIFLGCVEESKEVVEGVGKIAINPEHLPNTTQYGYSQAVSVGPNTKVVYVAGQIGISENGPNDFESQVDRSFQKQPLQPRRSPGSGQPPRWVGRRSPTRRG